MTAKRERLLAFLRFLSRFAPPWQQDEWLREWPVETVEELQSLEAECDRR